MASNEGRSKEKRQPADERAQHISASSQMNSGSAAKKVEKCIHAGEEGMKAVGMTQRNAGQDRQQPGKKKTAEKCEICNRPMTRSEIGSRCPTGPTGLGFKPGSPCCSDCTATLEKQLKWYREDQQKKYPPPKKTARLRTSRLRLLTVFSSACLV